MRRSILIVMLDVMVLSVLALTARQRAGGGTIANIPVPASGLTRMVEEGLRNEAGFRAEIARLEAQLKESADVARKALEQAALSETESDLERAEREKMVAQLHQTELEAERARAEAALAAKETELVNKQAALADQRMRELEEREAAAKARTHEVELREMEAKARADAALARMAAAEEKAQLAEQQAEEAARSIDEKDTKLLGLQQQMQMVLAAQKLAEEQSRTLAVSLASQEQQLLAARTAEAEARAKAAVAAEERERLALKAEKLEAENELSGNEKSAEVLALRHEMQLARAAQKLAEEQSEKMAITLSEQEAALLASRSAEAAARAKAQVAAEERERLTLKTEAVGEELVQARESVAALQERTKADVEIIEQLAQEKQQVAEEQNKSIWVRRDEALRKVTISYTEFNSANGLSYSTDKQLMMPMVKLDRFVLCPAEFRTLGLKKSFFGGLSERVVDVRGSVAPMVGDGKPGPLNAVIVPSAEPQVCLVHSLGDISGALEPVTMQGLKEQRLKTAMLFSPEDENAYGQVEIIPVVGRDYLKVRAQSGKKPKVGDYLLTERGQFVGVMVESDICSVMDNKLTKTPKPVIIPLTQRGKDELYWNDFVQNLNLARDLLEKHLDTRKL